MSIIHSNVFISSIKIRLLLNSPTFRTWIWKPIYILHFLKYISYIIVRHNRTRNFIWFFAYYVRNKFRNISWEIKKNINVLKEANEWTTAPFELIIYRWPMYIYIYMRPDYYTGSAMSGARHFSRPAKSTKAFVMQMRYYVAKRPS